MSTLVSERNLLSVNVRAVFRPYNLHWLFQLQLQGLSDVMTLICGSLWAAPGQRDRMSGQVCARCCEFRNVSVCGWVYVRACVCAKGKVDINNLCCIYFYLLLSPPCGSVFMLFLKICFAPWIVRGFDWMRWIQNRQILQSGINCTQNVLISMSVAASGSVVPVPDCISMYVLTLRFKKLKKYDIHVFMNWTVGFLSLFIFTA